MGRAGAILRTGRTLTAVIEAAGSGIVLAHQGGWDEVLLIAGPIVVVVGLLALVKRRVEEAAQQAVDKSDNSSER